MNEEQRTEEVIENLFRIQMVAAPLTEEPVHVRVGRATMADLVRRWREEAGKSVFEVADALGFEPKRIVEMEIGNDNFDLDVLETIAGLAGKDKSTVAREVLWGFSARSSEYEGRR